MAALKVAALALLAVLGSAQSPSCIDTDATVRELLVEIRPTGPLLAWLAHSALSFAVHRGRRRAGDCHEQQHDNQVDDGPAGGTSSSGRCIAGPIAVPSAVQLCPLRLQDAFCQEAPTSPLCNGDYEYTPSRPGNKSPTCRTERNLFTASAALS